MDYVRVWQRSDGNPVHNVPLPAKAETAGVFGTPGTSETAGPAALFDGDTATAYDAAHGDGCYAGMDAGAPTTVDQLRFWPRANADVNRTVGGQVQAADGPGGPWTTLHTSGTRCGPGIGKPYSSRTTSPTGTTATRVRLGGALQHGGTRTAHLDRRGAAPIVSRNEADARTR
ncbi:hypothetical protein BKD26_05910 [Streptomyces sp. CB03238]|nr:hypothetical protein BKD26_05910 [Streptomyces sp. CB03238]